MKSRISKAVIKRLLYLAFGLILLEMLLRSGGFVWLHGKDFVNGIIYESNSPANAYRILALGESTTEGGGSDAWPNQLERILNDISTTMKFKVYNKGVGGTNSSFIVARLKGHIHKYRPDMVITMMGANDNSNNPFIYEVGAFERVSFFLKNSRVCKLTKLILSSIDSAMRKNGWEINKMTKLDCSLLMSGDESLRYGRNDGRVLIENFSRGQNIEEMDLAGGLDHAEAIVKKEIAFNRRNVKAYIALARIYLEKSRFIEAKEAILLALYFSDQDTSFEAYSTISSHCSDIITKSEIVEIYRNTGIFVKLPKNIMKMHQRKNETMKNNYKTVYKLLKRKNIKYVAMNYPTRDIEELKEIFNGDEDILFVSNEENFKEALENGEYKDYFIDRCYKTFGHGNSRGNRLIAENIASAILKELGS